MLDEERYQFIEEECGVFAIHCHPEAANLTYLGLHALQHRGQESAGIVTCDFDSHLPFSVQRHPGLVGESFTKKILEKLKGDTAIGHVRYSTSGGSGVVNAQPINVFTKYGPVAIAHNGNLTNALALRRSLEQQGSIFGTNSDTEVLAHLVAQSDKEEVLDALIDAFKQVEGAYSIVVLTQDRLIAVRDPHGVRPLIVGRCEGRRVIASEPSSFQLIGATTEREVEPGELLVIEKDGSEKWLYPFDHVNPKPCIFELVYFARPNSKIFNRDVYLTRKQMGRILARETGVDADVVIAVPDSGVPAALGFAQETGIPFEIGLVRSHYVGRTFIEPSSSIRHFGVKLKLSPVIPVVEGKRVVVIDDSIVRGTTSRKIVKMLREAGAAEVHFRVASPPTVNPCFYGIDTPSRSQLIAATHTHNETCRYITADTLGYLSQEGLREAVHASIETDGSCDFCEACFSGDYPIPLTDQNPQQEVAVSQ